MSINYTYIFIIVTGCFIIYLLDLAMTRNNRLKNEEILNEGLREDIRGLESHCLYLRNRLAELREVLNEETEDS